MCSQDTFGPVAYKTSVNRRDFMPTALPSTGSARTPQKSSSRRAHLSSVIINNQNMNDSHKTPPSNLSSPPHEQPSRCVPVHSNSCSSRAPNESLIKPSSPPIVSIRLTSSQRLPPTTSSIVHLPLPMFHYATSPDQTHSVQPPTRPVQTWQPYHER